MNSFPRQVVIQLPQLKPLTQQVKESIRKVEESIKIYNNL